MNITTATEGVEFQWGPSPGAAEGLRFFPGEPSGLESRILVPVHLRRTIDPFGVAGRE
jgi:hypothetical protein